LKSLSSAWLVVRSAVAAPASISGLLLAVPITGNELPCFTLPPYGAAATAALLRGFARGLSGFGALFDALHAGLGSSGSGLSYGLAWGTALLTAASLYAWQHKRIALAA
jgi:hypothetical protein